MCWTTENSSYTKIRTAEKDIEVFKIVNLSLNPLDTEEYLFYSVYKHFQYKIGGKYNCEIGEIGEVDRLFYINEGIHSYSKKVKIIHCNDYIDDYYTSAICVFHNNIKLDYFYYKPIYVKLKCVIPKGSQYYENEHGEIVSNTIKVISFEEI